MKLRLGISACWIVNAGFTQSVPKAVEVQIVQPQQNGNLTPARMIANLRRAANKEPTSGWSNDAAALFEMSQAATRDLFRFDHWSLRARSVKIGTPTGDHLRAEWDFAQTTAAASGSVVLYDAPDLSTYFVRVDGVSITQFEGFLASSLNWEALPGKKPLKLVIERYADGGAVFEKLVLGSSTDAHILNVKGATADGTGWYLQITLGKGLLRRHYPELAFMQERIPPLPDAVTTWSQVRILEQLNSAPGSTPRNAILIQELAKRDPSDSTLSEVLLRAKRDPSELDQRFRQILQTLNRADPTLLRSKRFAEASLREFERIGLAADEAAVSAFPATCEDPMYEPWAAKMLTSGSLQRAPLRYLTSCGASAETEAILSRVDLPGHLKSLKMDALDAVRGRLRRATGQGIR